MTTCCALTEGSEALSYSLYDRLGNARNVMEPCRTESSRTEEWTEVYTASVDVSSCYISSTRYAFIGPSRCIREQEGQVGG